jgi:hypothetical protein
MPDDVAGTEKQLRDAIARLMTRNLELAREVEDLKRERSQTPVESIASAVTQSVRSAEAALAAEAGSGARYTVSEIDATFRGTVLASPAGVALRMPIPEYGVLPGHLGSVRLTIAAVPPPVSKSTTVAPPSTPAVRLTAALEDLQARLNRRSVRHGAAAAKDGVAHATGLLAASAQWGDAETLASGAEGLATALRQMVKAAPTRDRAALSGAEVYRDAAKQLSDIARSLRLNKVTPADAIADLAGAIEHAVRAETPSP